MLRLLGKSRGREFLALAATLLVAASVANADPSSVFFRIEAANGSQSGFVDIPLSSATQVGSTWSWVGFNVDIQDGSSNSIAMLNIGQLQMVLTPGEQRVNLFFNVMAGAVDTEFTLSTATLAFPAISPASGVLSGGLSLTDDSGDATPGSPAHLTGLTPAGNTILGQYNGAVPGGTTFADIEDDLYVTDAGLGTTSPGSRVPPVGELAIGAPVSDISMQVHFRLTANDTASGTATFRVIPEPSALALLVLGSLMGLRRR